ncbi:helix-turn-helix domain-containing protein [Nocardiopsis sp. NPDC101807]|uniref:helix-turn-helix domain-containing protein n=1 Tax=Nocardiopsis sp. NPDC101807 TaxID=3364339 RepID=UPI003828567A
MTAKASPPTAPTVARWILARELRRLRGDRPFNQVVKAVRAQSSSLSRWESGKADGQVPGVHSLERLLAYYEVGPDEVARIMELRRIARTPGWWQGHDVEKHYGTFIGLEEAAFELSTFESQLIPGLFQTEDYARSVIRAVHVANRASPEDIEDLVQVRMRRQSAWQERGTPHVWAIVGEAAIRQAVGGPSTMRQQLERLLELSEVQERVTFQVLPYSSGSHSAMEMACFTVLDVQEAGLSTVFIEGPTAQLFLDWPKDVEHYRRIFEHLRKSALNTTDTQALVASIREGFE